jgi:RNA recognition motif-containing protein
MILIDLHYRENFIFLGDKRKLDEIDTKPSKGYNIMMCTDLIVLGLPYQLTETQMREYFVQFGKLVMVQVLNRNIFY